MAHINEQIDRIIDMRRGTGDFAGNGHLQAVAARKQDLINVKQAVEEFASLRNTALRQIASGKGEFANMAADDPTLEQKLQLAETDSAMTLIDDSIKECERLETRFSRDTINISVIGRARQGKSRLLQAISGLGGDIIPADNGADCTGAKSMICNEVGKATHAQVFFYNEMELCQQVQKYLDAIGTGLQLSSAKQIPHIKDSEINRPEFFQDRTAEKSALLKHLRKFINHWGDYAPNLGLTIDLDSEEHIRDYVAQYDTKGNPTFNYLGVKEVKIFTQFNYPQAGRIMLVDTIGLGDTALGIQEKLVQTLVNDSDAAVLLRLPASTGDHISQDDVKMLDMLKAQVANRQLGKWLFFVINTWQQNKKQGEILQKELQELLGSDGKDTFLIQLNCANPDEVEQQLLIPLLQTLTNNLREVDNNLMASANLVLEQAYTAFKALSDHVHELLSNKFRQALNEGGLFDRLYEELPLGQKLELLNNLFRGDNRECPEIKDEISNVMARMVDQCPTQEQITQALSLGNRQGHAATVYNDLADFMRTAINDLFEEINHNTIHNLQENIKRQIVDALKADDGGKLTDLHVDIDDEDKDKPTAWLKALIEQKMAEFPRLAEALNEVADYGLHIEGNLTCQVVRALEFLDPEFPDKFPPLNVRQTVDKKALAEDIEQALLDSLQPISRALQQGLGNLLTMPYTLFYALIRRLRDKIIYSHEGERELKEFYRRYAGDIWQEQFKSIIAQQNTSQALRDIDEQLRAGRNKKLFTLKID